MKKKILAIIPARMASSRFPGKPMALINNLPMIGHCYLRTIMSKRSSDCYVATPDNEIFDYIHSINGKAVMTSHNHEMCNDRVFEAVEIIEKADNQKFKIIVNIQGDLPMVFPSMIDSLIGPLVTSDDATNTTMVDEIKIIDDFLQFAVDCRLIAFESKYDYVKEIGKSESLDFYDISFSKFYGSNLLLKTILDKFLSIIILILISPILLICSLFIVLEDGFPILFSQKRTGWDAREFYMYKLRSLYKDNLNPEKQVAAGDIRVTRVGKIMRRFSIDELPQFFNVLKGDMSIVGPRPHMIEHSSFYSKQIRNFFQRHKSSPGITGWAQVKGLRGPTTTNELMKKRVEADLWYLKNWSIWLDLIIIIRTLLVVLRQKVD